MSQGGLVDEIASLADADDRLARENRSLRHALGEERHRRRALEDKLALISTVDGARLKPPKWTLPRKRDTEHRGIVCMVIADTHFDEVVDPVQVGGFNAYDRRIAEMRLRRTFEKGAILARDYVQGIRYDGACLFLAGDMFSGNIHDELKETNQGTVYEALLHWIDPLVAGIELWRDEFGQVVVPCTPGNHGRNTKKPRAKNRAADNIDWLLYRMLARHFERDTRVTVMAPSSADTLVSLYGTTYLLTHGDQFRGGSGISGMFSPLMLGQHRKTRRQTAMGQPYEFLVAGHFHSYFHGKGLIISGTLKGQDEYSYVSNFEPEPPSQAWWVSTPEHGPSFATAVYPMDRKEEGW